MRLFDKASELAVRNLSSDGLTRARNLYMAARRRMHPLMRRYYGTFDVESLREHLDTTVGVDFEILMVHSSVNNMQPMYTGSPLELVRMLMDFCGPDRTLAMPTFYFGEPGLGGPRVVFSKNPRANIRKIPSQVGIVSELFRRSPGVVHSRHPVYRVSARGPLALALTEGHETAGTPAGFGTPFDFMAKRNTVILGLGKHIEVMTQVRHAEYVLGDQFPVPAEPEEAPVAMTVVDGNEEVPFALSARGFQWQRDIWRLRKIMGADELHEWRFHHVPLFATRADAVTKALVQAARRGVTIYRRP